MTAGARRGSALDHWLRERLAEPARGVRREAVADPPPGWRAGKPVLLRAPLGEPGSPLGQFVLLGAGGRRGLAADAIPSGFPREFGRAMEQVWRLHQRTLRLEVINEVTALSARTVSPEHIYDTVAEAVGRLVRFDALSVTLFDRERDEMRVLDVAARAGLPEGGDLRLAPADTLDGVGGGAPDAPTGGRPVRSLRAAGEPRAPVAAGLPLRDRGPRCSRRAT